MDSSFPEISTNYEKKPGMFEKEKLLRNYESIKTRENSNLRDLEIMICGSLKMQQKSLFNKWKTFYFELHRDTLYKFTKEGNFFF